MSKFLFVLMLLASLSGFACAQSQQLQQQQGISVGTCLAGPPNCGPALKSLVITPTNPTLVNGLTLQMRAEGVENDASGSDAGSYGPQCDGLWSSSSPGVATISTFGLVTAVSVGASTISCQLNSFISGSTLLTVVGAPHISSPTCATPPCSLPGGTNGSSYSFTFAATGGTAPYTWDCNGSCSGLLPTGLSLSSGGVLSGTPSVNQTKTWTVRVTDNLSNSNTLSVTMTVVAAVCSFPTLCGSTSLSTIVYPSIPPNIGGLVGAGTTYTDPTFGSTGLRVTDSLTDPSTAGKNSNTYGASLSGSDDENAWSSDDSMFFVASNGGTIYMYSFAPSTLTLGRPYSGNTSGCPTGRSNCSTYGGWSSNTGSFFFSNQTPCKLYNQNGTQLNYYLFDCPTFATPPSSVSVINYIENAPAGCVGTACNGLPSDFGTPTWIGNAGTGAGDAFFCANFASAAYNDGSGTGQNHGVWAVCYVPGKGITSYNTQTNVIHADPGFAGGSGLTCNGTQCTGTATSPGTYTIHSGKVNLSATEDYINISAVLSGTSSPSDSLVWIPGTNIVYLAENNNKASGHGCFGSLGMWNQPGSPLNGWYYRTTPTTPPSGTPTLITTVFSPDTTQFDTHCGPQTAGASDTNPVGFQASSNSQSSSGCCELPLDQPPQPWLNELDFMTNDASGHVFREMLTYNSGFSNVDFDSQNTITNCNSGASGHGLFCLFGTDWFGTLGNVGGTSSSCIPSGPAWLGQKNYPLNYVIKPTHNNTAGNVYKATVSGIAGTTEPNWGASCSTLNAICTETSGLAWTNLGTSSGTAACRTDVILGVMK